MRADYYTVKNYGENELIIQKSKFLTYVKRAETEQEAIDFIQEIKKCITQQLIIVRRI